MTDTARLQQNLNAYWSGRALAYDDHQRRPERSGPDRAAWSDIFTAALPPTPADVLDLGTGSGYVALLLASLGHRVTATDLAEGMLVRAGEHAAASAAPPTFLHGDAVAPDFAPASFDAITNRYLMWTLREPKEALANWRRLLRPGGVLAVVDSTWFPHGRGVGVTGEFAASYDDEVRAGLPLSEAGSIEETGAAVEAAGFADVTLTPLTTILDLDRIHGVAPHHEVRLQHLIRGVA